MRPQFLVLCLLVLSGPRVSSAQEVQTSDPVAESWARATQLESEKRFDEAARELGTVAARYPQDFATQLQVAWLYFQAGDYPRAELYYSIADGLAEGPGLARLGLAWSRYYLGDSVGARAGFEAYLTAHPENPSTAPQGLALVKKAEEATRTERAWKVSFNAMPVLVHTYQDHPDKQGAYGVGLGLTFEQSGFWLNANYAYSRYELVRGWSTVAQAVQLAQMAGDGTGNGTQARNNGDGTGTGGQDGTSNGTGGNGNAAGKAFGEHAGFVGVGYGGQTLGLTLYGAYLENDGGVHGVVSAGGATMRLSVWNDLYLGGTFAHINNDDGIDARIAYDVALGHGWWLTPGGILHKWDDRPLMGSGKFAISKRAGAIRGYVSGRYGRSYHEVDFVQSLVASHSDDVVWGGAAGLSLWPTERWSVGGFFSAEGYERRGAPASIGLFGGVTMTVSVMGD